MGQRREGGASFSSGCGLKFGVFYSHPSLQVLKCLEEKRISMGRPTAVRKSCKHGKEFT